MNDPRHTPEQYISVFNPNSKQNPDGSWVSEEDYSRLLAEHGLLLFENSNLKEENERLRMAGDCLIGVLGEMDVIMDMDSDHPEVDAWNSAKDGNETK